MRRGIVQAGGVGLDAGKVERTGLRLARAARGPAGKQPAGAGVNADAGQVVAHLHHGAEGFRKRQVVRLALQLAGDAADQGAGIRGVIGYRTRRLCDRLLRACGCVGAERVRVQRRIHQGGNQHGDGGHAADQQHHQAGQGKRLLFHAPSSAFCRRRASGEMSNRFLKQ